MSEPDETIVLELPAMARHLRHVRLAAATVAADLGMDIESIEDLRVGVNELFSLLIDDLDATSRIRAEIVARNDSVVIEGSVETGEAAPVADVLAAQILDVVVDEHGMNTAGGRRTARLVKRVGVRV